MNDFNDVLMDYDSIRCVQEGSRVARWILEATDSKRLNKSDQITPK